MRWTAIGIGVVPGLLLMVPAGTPERVLVWNVCLAIFVAAVVVIVRAEWKLRSLGWMREDGRG